MARKRKKSKSDARPAKGEVEGGAPADSEASRQDAQPAAAKPDIIKTTKKSTKMAPTRKRDAKKHGEPSAPVVDEAVAPALEASSPTTEPGATDLHATAELVDLDVGEQVIDLDAEVIDLDAEVVDLDAEVEIIDLDDEPALEVFDLDGDLETGDAAAKLLAETMALLESEDGSSEPPAAASSQDTSVAEAPDAPAVDGPARVGEAVVAPESNPDLAVAMSELRHAGLDRHLDEDTFDLGDASTGDDRDRLLAAALAHSEMQEAIYRVPVDTGQSRRWKGTIASLVFVIAMFVAASPPGIVVPDPPARITDGDRLYGIRVTLLIQSQQVEAFRAREQRLPDSLAEVAVRLPGVRFVKSSNRLYQLIAYTSRGEAVVYDSATPAPEFSDVARGWITTRGGS